MNQVVSPAKLRVWKLMEFAGILHGRKRTTLMEELFRKEKLGELDPDERRIWNAQIIHPHDKQARRRRLKQELKAWEKRANHYSV